MEVEIADNPLKVPGEETLLKEKKRIWLDKPSVPAATRLPAEVAEQ